LGFGGGVAMVLGGVGWQVRRTVENAVDSHVTRDEDGHMSQLIDRPHQIAMSGPGGTSERQGAEVT